MIDQRRCKYIKAIASCHSFSRAAQQLYISQPSLSRFVKNVEEELGIELFDRETIPLSLTAAGEKYLDYINRFQRLEQDMQADFAALNAGMLSQLSIAALPFLGTYVLPKIIPRFASRYPSVDLQIEELSNRELLQRIANGESDLALTNLCQSSDLYDCCKLGSDHIVLAALYNEKMQKLFPNQTSSPDNPLQEDLSFLEKETLIVLRPWQNMRVAAEAICRRYSLTPQHVIEAPSLASALSLVGSNRGVTFVCQSSVSSIRPSSPLIYFSAGEMENYTSILAVYRKGNTNPLIREFCSCATSALKSAATSSSLT